ncbi:MAG TPA: hypothetical protein VIU45_04120, partial [Chitinophagaceae bacterium]
IANEVIKDCQQQLNYYQALTGNELSPDLQQDAQSAQYFITQLQTLKDRYAKTGASNELMKKIDSLSPAPAASGDSGKPKK